MKTLTTILSSALLAMSALQVQAESSLSSKTIPLLLNKKQVQLAQIKLQEKQGTVDEIILSGLDSLQLIEMATDLEQRFGVRIESELADIVTFRDLANVIQAHTQQASE